MTVNIHRRLRTDRGEVGADKMNPGLWGKEVEAADPVAATPPAGSPNAENHLVEAPVAEEADVEAPEEPEAPSEPEEPTEDPEVEESAEEPSEEPSDEDETEV